jgi:hypothetical protein
MTGVRGVIALGETPTYLLGKCQGRVTGDLHFHGFVEGRGGPSQGSDRSNSRGWYS